MPLAADRDRRATRLRIGKMLLDLRQRFGVDQRTLRDTGLGAAPDFERADLRRELPRKRVVNLLVNEEAVRANARLARVAILRDDRAVGRRIEIGIVEHDERRVAAELERDLLDR